MARPAKYTNKDLLDAAAAVTARRWREATITDVAAELGAPVGSLYHRFASRDDLFGSLWVREIRRFHDGLLAAAVDDDPERAMIACAVYIPRYCRRHPERAIAMTLFRQADLVDRVSDDDVRREVAEINDEVEAAMTDLTRRRFGSATRRRLELAVSAVQEVPYGLVRSRIGARAPIPRWVDAAVAGCVPEILALGDTASV